MLALGAPTTAAGGFSVPTHLHFSNFSAAFNEAGFGPALKTSAIMTVSIVVISVVLSVPAGYAFALMRFRGRSFSSI